MQTRYIYLTRFELWFYGVADVRLLQVKTYANTAFPRRWKPIHGSKISRAA